MAFVNTIPHSTVRFVSAFGGRNLELCGRKSLRTAHTRRYPKMVEEQNTATVTPSTPPGSTSSGGPTKPDDFQAPEPRRGYVRSDTIVDIASGALASLVRAGAGAVVEGYTLNLADDRREYSKTLPNVRPRLPIRVFEFEACPFCRKVREAINMLDLDVLFFPCPSGGKVYREYVKSKGGKSQFPYIEDPNTGYAGYESLDIIEYLYKTYGPQNARVPLILKNAGTFTAGMASAIRSFKGRKRELATVPAPKALELYGYEASPFSKIVRERLNELELPYYLYSTPRGSPTRKKLQELTGRVQTPYLIDPNTGVSMFESAAIVDYLSATYGPNAKGAVETPAPGTAFLPKFDSGATDEEPEMKPVGSDASEPSLNPKMPRDERLEEYCEDNPETDECRVYEE